MPTISASTLLSSPPALPRVAPSEGDKLSSSLNAQSKLKPEQQVRASAVVARFTNGDIGEQSATQRLTAIGLSATEAAARLQGVVPLGAPGTDEVGKVPLPSESRSTPKLSVSTLLTAQSTRG